MLVVRSNKIIFYCCVISNTKTKPSTLTCAMCEAFAWQNKIHCNHPISCECVRRLDCCYFAFLPLNLATQQVVNLPALLMASCGDRSHKLSSRRGVALTPPA